MNKNFEPKKKLILQKIVEIAKESGSPPGVQAFATQTGIKKHEWEGKIWARWSDALIESGLKPNLIGVALDK